MVQTADILAAALSVLRILVTVLVTVNFFVVRQLVRGFHLMLLTAEKLLEALHGAPLNYFRKKGLLSCLGRCSFWIFTKQPTMLSILFVFFRHSGKLRKGTFTYGLIARSTFYTTHQSVSTQIFDVKCHRTWHTDSVLQYRRIASSIWCTEVWRKTLNIQLLYTKEPTWCSLAVCLFVTAI